MDAPAALEQRTAQLADSETESMSHPVMPTVRLSEDALAALRDIAHKRGSNDIEEALLRAIADEWFIANALAEGSNILVERPDKSIEELIFE
jgi:hypothetical protein